MQRVRTFVYIPARHIVRVMFFLSFNAEDEISFSIYKIIRIYIFDLIFCAHNRRKDLIKMFQITIYL